MKVVINRCFGGFALSEAGRKELCLRKGWILNPNGVATTFDGEFVSLLALNRTDPDVVAVVEELGDEASATGSRLKVVDVPDDVEWFIHNYDGLESVHEKNRVWTVWE